MYNNYISFYRFSRDQFLRLQFFLAFVKRLLAKKKKKNKKKYL